MVAEKPEHKKEEIIEEEVEETDEFIPQEPALRLAEIRHLLSLDDTIVPASEKATLRVEATNICKKDNMSFLYKHTFGSDVDEELLKTMEEENKTKLAALEQERVEGEAGTDFDLQEHNMKKAKYLVQIGDKASAFPLLEECLSKAVGGTTRIDIANIALRLALAYDERKHWVSWTEKLSTLVDKDGDWERRNRTAIYKAAMLMSRNQVKEASALLVPGIPTYTCTELMSFDSMVTMTVLAALVSLNRVDLRNKIINSSDVTQALLDQPVLKNFLYSYYECKSEQFMKALVEMEPIILRNRYFAPHVSTYARQATLVAMKQYLTSFHSVTLAAMARAFGLTVESLESRLVEYIALGKLPAVINAVKGTVEVHSNDSKGVKYDNLVNIGDEVLSKATALAQRLTAL